MRGLGRAALLSASVLAVHSQSFVQVGYTVLSASPGGAVPVSTALFGFTNASGTLVSEAAVGASVPIASGRVFVDEAGTFTSIALANPSARIAALSLVLRDALGREVDRKPLSLGAGEQVARYVAELFPARDTFNHRIRAVKGPLP